MTCTRKEVERDDQVKDSGQKGKLTSKKLDLRGEIRISTKTLLGLNVVEGWWWRIARESNTRDPLVGMPILEKDYLIDRESMAWMEE